MGEFLTGVWISIPLWLRMTRTISSGFTGSMHSSMHNAVSIAINTPVRPIPALCNDQGYAMIVHMHMYTQAQTHTQALHTGAHTYAHSHAHRHTQLHIIHTCNVLWLVLPFLLSLLVHVEQNSRTPLLYLAHLTHTRLMIDMSHHHDTIIP